MEHSLQTETQQKTKHLTFEQNYEKQYSTSTTQGRVKAAKDYCRRQIIFDLSATPIPEKHTKVLSELGLSFQIAPKVFPVVETISATEVCCQEIEKGEGDPIFLKEKAAKIRQTVLTHIQKYHDKPIKSNILTKEWKTINYIKKSQKTEELVVGKS